MNRATRIAALRAAARERILIIDGAMGTMIQRHKLGEAEYRGARFADWASDIKGNNDLLVLSQPAIIQGIHADYIAAGADIIETNTFNAQTISMADYGMAALADEINTAAATLARRAADAAGRPVWVAGAIGPTNRTASISPDVNRPGFRNVSFDELREAYRAQALALIAAGVDIILIETIFDTLNAKAAGMAVLEAFDAAGETLPIMISGTVTDLSGRNLSGQTPEAFAISMAHLEPFAIGLNCAFGAEHLRAPIAEMAATVPVYVSAYPNAGLPNAMGEYDETPEEMAASLQEWARAGLVNMLGGCCGSTPDHIAAIAAAVAGLPPRVPPRATPQLSLSGLEAFHAA